MKNYIQDIIMAVLIFQSIILYFILFSFATRAGPPQQREPITVGPYYLPPCQLSLWEETGVPYAFFHMRTGFESTLR